MIRKVFKQMTFVQILSSAMVSVCLLVDSIVIARLIGVDAVSAYGLANPLLILFTSLGTMMSVGVQVVIGETMGRGDVKGCTRMYSTSIGMSLILAVLWLFIVFVFTDPICTLLGAGRPSSDNQIFTMTGEYLRGFILGAPFFFLSQVMVPYLQAMGRRKIAAVSTLAMTAVDVILDLLSVYVFHAGMFGIGIASGLSYLVAMLACMGFFLRKDCLFKFNPKGIGLKMMRHMLYAGIPVLVVQASFMVRAYFINRILMKVSGTIAVAVFAVISTTGTICFCIGLGSGSVALMLASIFYGEEDRSSIYELIKTMTTHSLKLIIAVMIVVELTAPWIAGMFLGNYPSVLSIAIPGFRIYLLSLIPCVLANVFKNYYQGTGRMWLTNFISLCQNIILVLPCVWILGTMMGVTGVWIGVIAGEAATLLAFSIIVWVRNRKVSFSAEAYSLLDRDFGANPSEVFEMSVTDMDTAVGASQKIDDFCKSKGLGSRVSMLVSLCVEEIVVNIIRHGFTQDDSAHNADIRVVIDEKKCIIRVRDNCIGFDPTSYMQLYKNDDPTAHIGIRVVMGMASEVSYMNTLGLNNLHMSILRG